MTNKNNEVEKYCGINGCGETLKHIGFYVCDKCKLNNAISLAKSESQKEIDELKRELKEYETATTFSNEQMNILCKEVDGAKQQERERILKMIEKQKRTMNGRVNEIDQCCIDELNELKQQITHAEQSSSISTELRNSKSLKIDKGETNER